MTTIIQAEEFATEIEALFNAVIQKLPEILQIQAMDLRAVIRDRIQQKGLDGDGNQMEGYSPSYRKSKAERYGAESVAHRNYTATGNMWRELQITGVKDSPEEVSVIIEGRTAAAKDKFNYPAEPDSRNPGKVIRDILKATPEEIEAITELIDSMIQELIEERGF